MPVTKTDENRTNVLNSKQIACHKQYLFSIFYSRNAKKTRTDQSILQLFLLCLKRNDW